MFDTTTYTVRVVFHRSADHRLGNARPRFSSSLCELRVLRGAHCDWIASLLNATGAIQHEYFDGSSLDQVFDDLTVLSGVLWPLDRAFKARRKDDRTGPPDGLYQKSRAAALVSAVVPVVEFQHLFCSIARKPSHPAMSIIQTAD